MSQSPSPTPPETPWWKSPPVLINTAIGILGIALGFLALPATGAKSPTGVTNTTTATATVTAKPSKAGPPAPPSPDPEKVSVRWEGPLLVSEGPEGADLDALPPKVNEFNDDLGLHSIDAGGEAEVRADRLALVPSGRSPDLQDCSNLTATKGVDSVAVTEGRMFCVETDKGRIALLTLNEVHPEAESIDVTVTVWEKPD